MRCLLRLSRSGGARWASRRTGALALVIGASIAASASPAAADWAVQSVAAPEMPSGQLSGISCWATKGCVAVGSATTRGGTQVAVAETWNGKRWSAQRAAIPPDVDASSLAGVACVSKRLCLAVGGVTDSTGKHELALIARWNGRHWSVVPNGGRGDLSAVSCASRSACVAVGKRVVERWNGKRWTVAHQLRGQQSLASVSCSSATTCMAVGESHGVNFAERYDGRAWTSQSIPTPGDEEDYLTGVSCVSARACLATGATVVDSDGDTLTVTEHWNGSKWSIQNPPNTVESQTLNGLSCMAANACVAVGALTTFGGPNHPLVEQWNGRRWAVRFTARPHGANGGSFAAVSCLSKMCDAVGSFTTQPLASHPLAERFDGARWRVKPTAGFVGGASGALNSVSCTATSTCTAVGDYTDSAGTQVTLAERDSGGGWVVQPTPDEAAAGISTLSAVSCASGTACMAVGWYCQSAEDGCGSDGEANLPLAEIWDGSKWTIVPVRIPPGSASSQLSGVSCTAPTSCLAVGDQQAQGNEVIFAPLIEAWNGSNWTIEHAPVPTGSRDSRLTAVACSSPTACTAVGTFGALGQAFNAPLAEALNGSTWAVQTPPLAPAEIGGQLNAVSCSAPGDCMAVGAGEADNANPALIETSVGSTWTAMTPLGSVQDSLAGVSCSSPNGCLAVGKSTEENTGMAALGWDGAAWTDEAVAEPSGAISGQLNGVSCASGTSCIGVGSFATTLSGSQPVVEEHS